MKIIDVLILDQIYMVYFQNEQNSKSSSMSEGRVEVHRRLVRLHSLHSAEKLNSKEEEHLYYAICSDDSGRLKQLIESGLNANAKFDGCNHLGKSLLHLCCEKGCCECAKLLLELGAHPDVKDDWKQTPLIYAVCTEREDMVEILLKAECYINSQDTWVDCILLCMVLLCMLCV